MSVLIKGMEMPTSCANCDLAKHFDGYNENDCPFNCFSYYDCLLVPVPPHGIIDRKQILDAIRLELAQANAVNDMDDYDEWMRVFDYIRKFPTIIPAEEGET